MYLIIIKEWFTIGLKSSNSWEWLGQKGITFFTQFAIRFQLMKSLQVNWHPFYDFTPCFRGFYPLIGMVEQEPNTSNHYKTDRYKYW